MGVPHGGLLYWTELQPAYKVLSYFLAAVEAQKLELLSFSYRKGAHSQPREGAGATWLASALLLLLGRTW